MEEQKLEAGGVGADDFLENPIKGASAADGRVWIPLYRRLIHPHHYPSRLALRHLRSLAKRSLLWCSLRLVTSLSQLRPFVWTHLIDPGKEEGEGILSSGAHGSKMTMDLLPCTVNPTQRTAWRSWKARVKSSVWSEPFGRSCHGILSSKLQFLKEMDLVHLNFIYPFTEWNPVSTSVNSKCRNCPRAWWAVMSTARMREY